MSSLVRYVPRGFGRRLALAGAYQAGRFVRRRGLSFAQKVMGRGRARRRGGRLGGRRGRRGAVGVRAMPGIGPAKQVFDFKMCFVRDIAGDATNKTQDMLIALSDPTDPTLALSADQPTGWEERAAFYDKAKVLSCSVSVRIEDDSTSGRPMVVGLIANTDVTLFNSATLGWTEWCEYPRAQHRFIKGTNSAAGTVANAPVVRLNYHTKPFKQFVEGLRNTKNEILLPDTSPANIVYLHILSSDWGEIVNTTAQDLHVTLVLRWKVLFYDRKNLAKGTDT